MATRNLGGFLVLIFAISICGAAAHDSQPFFNPISDSHRSENLELFATDHGSFASGEMEGSDFATYENHPYAPKDLKLPGFVPGFLSQSTILGVYGISSLLVVLVTWFFFGKRFELEMQSCRHTVLSSDFALKQ